MFRKECWARYSAGEYAYKNGVKVKREGREWVVYIYSKEYYRADTLKECKNYLGCTMN